MFFLNLTVGEFLGLLAVLGGIITALYLLDRAKRKKIVSTLRFWTPAITADEQQHRKRMREPWSFLLQLLSLVLLLLAIAQAEWGPRQRKALNHVLVLDTSSWTAERVRQGTLLDREKIVARQYLSRLPARDRVMLVRADGLATPVTAFTADPRTVSNALNSSTSGFSALNIREALTLAQQAQEWPGAARGETVYIGPGLIGEEGGNQSDVPNLRVVKVAADQNNCGIKHIGVKRSEDDPNSWQVTVTLKNYGDERKAVRLHLQFAGTDFANRTFVLSPKQEFGTEYTFATNTAGRLIAELDPPDVLAADNRAALELPKSGALRVAVFTSRPETLRPLFEANHRILVRYYSPSEYVPHPHADMMVLDQISPAEKPEIASLWIMPEAQRSPFPVKDTVKDVTVKTWHPESGIASGLHEKEARISSAEVFETFEGDLRVADSAAGPVIVARPAADGHPKLAEIGFDPLSGPLRFEVTTPLLFANLLRWLSPESFRELEVMAGRVGSATVTLDPGEPSRNIRVSDDDGFAVPFTIREKVVQLFVRQPSVTRISSEDRPRVLSLTLPEVGELEWNPPATAKSGLPAAVLSSSAIDLWKWFAVLSAVCLFIEWLLFGRQPARRPRKLKAAASHGRPSGLRRELVSK